MSWDFCSKTNLNSSWVVLTHLTAELLFLSIFTSESQQNVIKLAVSSDKCWLFSVNLICSVSMFSLSVFEKIAWFQTETFIKFQKQQKKITKKLVKTQKSMIAMDLGLWKSQMELNPRRIKISTRNFTRLIKMSWRIKKIHRKLDNISRWLKIKYRDDSTISKIKQRMKNPVLMIANLR